MEYVLEVLSLPDVSFRKTFGFCRAGLCHLKDHFVPHFRNNYHPHILGDRALALFSALLVTFKIFVLVAVSLGPVLPAFSSAITEANIINLTNQSRAAFNQPALSENAILDKAAQAKADDMLQKGYFSHNTPSGLTPWSFIQAAGYNYLMAGENLAVNFTQAEDIEQAWMNSPGHKANILNPNFEQIGIGIAEGLYQGHEAVFVVQMFGTPAEQKVLVTDTPTPLLTQTVPPPALPSRTVNHTFFATASDQSLKIFGEQVQIQGNQALIQAQLSANAVKVIAYFGPDAVMLSPKDNNLWTASVVLSTLAQANVQVKLRAYDMQGQSVEKPLADFASTTVGNYNVLGASNSLRIGWLGRVFDPKAVQDKFYLFFMAAILTSMVLAIGLKRHVQHLNLIANSSFVVILATLLWFAG